MNKDKKPFVIHPHLVAIFPVAALFASNTHMFYLHHTFFSFFILFHAVMLVNFVLGRAFRDRIKVGIILTTFIMLMFSYGHVRNLVGERGVDLGVFKLGTGKMVFGASILAFAAVAWITIRAKRSLAPVNRFLNAFAVVVLGIALVNAGIKVLFEQDRVREISSSRLNLPELEKPDLPPRPPDIYYIILDGYAREDVLRETYGFDNRKFLEHLESRGFYVAGQARSNYCQTTLTLSSSLNLCYHTDSYGRTKNPTRPMVNWLVKNSLAVEYLDNAGYETAAFESGYFPTEIENVRNRISQTAAVGEFEIEMLSLTPLPDLLNVIDRYDRHRGRLLYAVREMPSLAGGEKPKFVFAHVLAPHPPFVFKAGGEPVDPPRRFTLADGSHLVGVYSITREEYRKKYAAQLAYVNDLVMKAVDAILEKSETPPVIVIQGDHGPGSSLDWKNPDLAGVRERFAILYACLVPEDLKKNLYPEVTPVNTFRFLFNGLFGLKIEMEPDRCYYSGPEDAFSFVDITEDLDRGTDPSFEGAR